MIGGAAMLFAGPIGWVAGATTVIASVAIAVDGSEDISDAQK